MPHEMIARLMCRGLIVVLSHAIVLAVGLLVLSLTVRPDATPLPNSGRPRTQERPTPADGRREDGDSP